jgi:hypothetical protein
MICPHHFPEEGFAAATSRLAESMNSMVFPVESTARVVILQLFPTLMYVSSTL